MDVFLNYCLLKDSPVIDDKECKDLDGNFDLVVNQGRKPDLKLQDKMTEKTLQEWGNELLSGMSQVANILDLATNDQRYTKALAEQQAKLDSPELTPSAQVLAVMQQEELSWLEFAGELSKKHQKVLSADNLNHNSETFSLAAQQSFSAALEIKRDDRHSFDEYLLSYQTQ